MSLIIARAATEAQAWFWPGNQSPLAAALAGAMRRLALLLALPVFFGAGPAYVVDGDTLELSTGERTRLWGIDAVESDQFYHFPAATFSDGRRRGRSHRGAVSVVTEIWGVARLGRVNGDSAGVRLWSRRSACGSDWPGIGR